MAENMVKAGRAGLTFGGDWDETVEYNRLVGVRYDNKLFFSKKTVPIGLIPEDGEYWFLAYEGLTDEQWEALLNGTQQVGDSAKLGGKDASEYFLSSGTVLNTSILEYALTVPNGTHFICLGGNYHDGTDLPHSNYRYSCASIEKRSSTQLTVVLWGISAGYSFKVNHYTDGVWYGWKGFSDYLPLSGGTVSADNDTPITLKSNTSKAVYQRYVNSEGVGKFLGFNQDGDAEIVGKGELLHTGNKPTGTYTGNGDATQRDIATGGIGRACLIWASDTSGGAASTLLMQTGGFGQRSGQSIIFAQGVARYESGGTIRLLTADASLNEVGKTYTWIVI